jgi:hypothetical protein
MTFEDALDAVIDGKAVRHTKVVWRELKKSVLLDPYLNDAERAAIRADRKRAVRHLMGREQGELKPYRVRHEDLVATWEIAVRD